MNEAVAKVTFNIKMYMKSTELVLTYIMKLKSIFKMLHLDAKEGAP